MSISELSPSDCYYTGSATHQKIVISTVSFYLIAFGFMLVLRRIPTFFWGGGGFVRCTLFVLAAL